MIALLYSYACARFLYVDEKCVTYMYNLCQTPIHPNYKKNTNCDDATLFTDTVYDDLLKPENVTCIREVSAEANASVDESKRPASTEPAESFRKLNVDWCVLIECL